MTEDKVEVGSEKRIDQLRDGSENERKERTTIRPTVEGDVQVSQAASSAREINVSNEWMC